MAFPVGGKSSLLAGQTVRHPENLFELAQVLIDRFILRSGGLVVDSIFCGNVSFTFRPQVTGPKAAVALDPAIKAIDRAGAELILTRLRSRIIELNGPAVIAGELRTI